MKSSKQPPIRVVAMSDRPKTITFVYDEVVVNGRKVKQVRKIIAK